MFHSLKTSDAAVGFTGGGAEMTGLADYAQAALGRPVRIGKAPQLKGLPEAHAVPGFATLAGLVLYAAEDPIDVRAFGRESSQRAIHNKAPRPGEPAEFVNNGTDGQSGEEYAVLALMPNLESRGSVLLLTGTTMLSMEAAGEFLAAPDSLGRLRAALQRPAGPLPYFELLLRANRLSSVARGTTVVATRIVGERPR